MMVKGVETALKCNNDVITSCLFIRITFRVPGKVGIISLFLLFYTFIYETLS